MNKVKLDECCLYEIEGELYSLEELKAFIATCDELSKKTCRQTRFIEALKLNNGKLTQERNNAVAELDRVKNMSMWQFADKYCNDNELEDAGRQFARELLGGA